MIASPIKLSGTPIEYRQAPPRLGEHTWTVLKRYRSESELKQLEATGIIEAFTEQNDAVGVE